MMNRIYTVSRVNLLSLVKFGFFTGVVVSFPTGAAGLALALLAARAAARWLSGLTYELQVAPGLPGLQIRGAELLGLEKVQGPLTVLAQIGWIESLALLFLLCLGAGVISAGLALLGGLAYNLVAWLSGGLQVRLSEEAGPGDGRP